MLYPLGSNDVVDVRFSCGYVHAVVFVTQSCIQVMREGEVV